MTVFDAHEQEKIRGVFETLLADASPAPDLGALSGEIQGLDTRSAPHSRRWRAPLIVVASATAVLLAIGAVALVTAGQRPEPTLGSDDGTTGPEAPGDGVRSDPAPAPDEAEPAEPGSAASEPVLTMDGPDSGALLSVASEAAMESWRLQPRERFDIAFPEGVSGASVSFGFDGGTIQVFYQPFEFDRLDGENLRGTYMGVFEVWEGLGEAVLFEGGWRTHLTLFTYSGLAINTIVEVRPFDPTVTVPIDSDEIRVWTRAIAEELGRDR